MMCMGFDRDQNMNKVDKMMIANHSYDDYLIC